MKSVKEVSKKQMPWCYILLGCVSRVICCFFLKYDIESGITYKLGTF